MVVAGLARRTRGYSTRNGPPLAPSRYRFDLEVSIASSLARWAPQDCRGDSPTDPRDGSRELSLGHAARIHGELLKLGITVSQATVSRYMPRSPKDRRSQAWRTFVRNHAIAIVQSRAFDGHNWARDLLSQARSRSRVFTCRLSAFVVASVTDPSCWAAWYTVNPFLVAVARPRVWVSRIVALAPKSKVLAQRSPPATRKVDLFTIDRIRDPPTPHEPKHHVINALNWQTFVFYALKSAPRYRVFVKSPILPKYRPRIQSPPWGSLVFGAMFSMPICMRLTF